MQTASILLALGDDQANTVPKSNVTPAEIITLMAIHGESSVSEVDIADEDADINPREELDRLRRRYGGARDPENKPIIASLFPGAGARLPDTFAELGLEDMMFKGGEPPAKPKKAASSRKTKASAKKEDEQSTDEGDDSISEMPETGNAAMG